MRGGPFFYVLGKYYSDKKNRMVEIFWGPFASESECETQALKSLVPLQNASYEIKESHYGSRAMARQECVSGQIIGGGSVEDALTRYQRYPEQQMHG